MNCALKSTAACQAADQIAVKRAGLGAGAKILATKRKNLESYDLVYIVAGATGASKEVVVTNSELLRQMRRAPSCAG